MIDQFINSDSQPTGPDAVLAVDHVIADGVLVLPSGTCPARILAQGPGFRVKIGHTLCKVTSLGTGNVNWAIDVVENSIDDNYLAGTPIYLEHTAGALKDAIFDKPFVFTNDQTAQYPNSLVLPTIPVPSDANPQPTGAVDPGASPDYSRADHVHFSSGGGGGGSGSLVLLEEHVASASSQLDFTAWYNALYDEYLIEFVSIVPANNNVILAMRMSTDGGATYISSANYSWAEFTVRAAATGVQGAESGATEIRIGSFNIGNATNFGFDGSIRLFNPASTALYKTVMGQVSYVEGTPFRLTSTVRGSYESLTAVNALRFLMLSGNITSGTIRIYGVVKA